MTDITHPRSRRPDPMLLLILPALVVVIALFVYPFAYSVGLSLSPYPEAEQAARAGALSSYAFFFGDPRERAVIGTTLRLALPATAFNLLLATPIAYRMRRAFPGLRAVTTLMAIPMTLGAVFVASGLLELLPEHGWVNRTLLGLRLIKEPAILIHNYWGVLTSLVISEFPVVFLILVGYASGLDRNLERAARMLGAGSWQRFRRITLPLLLPGIAVASALSFVATFSVFPSAVMVGQPAGETRVIALAAWQAAFERFDYSEAAAIAVVMAVIELAFIALVLVLRARGYRGPGIGGR